MTDKPPAHVMPDLLPRIGDGQAAHLWAENCELRRRIRELEAEVENLKESGK